MEVNEYANLIRVAVSVSGVLFSYIWAVSGFYQTRNVTVYEGNADVSIVKTKTISCTLEFETVHYHSLSLYFKQIRIRR
jgi:hypothetical protein